MKRATTPYSAQVLDHFHHPRRAGEIAGATAVVESTNPVCGDILKLWAAVRDGRIAEVTFKAEGCVPAIACGSWLAEWLGGKELNALPPLSPEQIDAALGGLPPASKHAAELAAGALEELARSLSARALGRPAP